MIKDAKFLIMWFVRDCQRDYRTLLIAWKSILVGVTSLAYILSPIDLLPEAVLGVFGLIDDFAVLVIAVIIMANQVLQRI